MSPPPPAKDVHTVHWQLTVEEFAARNSPESWTSPLPTPPDTPVASPVTLPSTPPPSEASPPPLAAFTLPPTPPPAPQPTQNLPLPATLEVHELLTPVHALQLDFSFPSDVFRRNPQLTTALLAAPACSPPRTTLCVRIAAGMYKKGVQIRHIGAADGAVTVGDVLTMIQRELRQYDYGEAPAEAAAYMRRRIATVNGHSTRRDAAARAATVAAEREGGGRVVDHLLGHTMFAGLRLRPGHPDHYWDLVLEIPQRYAY
ncbi:hypothetical protein C8F04DRAFT_1262162 [Mycena alexandri]|uniref:DUF6699 domain-containing protein n=1 Tax=Mycena alexandri TaxID=1745969 RepID=A0AAD6SUU8_9AGAR|nr:hypothetical protein C8F04DRAFT_1262162 [Mycena alexandri]